MDREVNTVVKLVCEYLYNNLPRRRVADFSQCLAKVIQNRLISTNSWHPESPHLGMQHRCLRLTGPHADLDILPMAIELIGAWGLNLAEVTSCLPGSKLTVWIDPGEITYCIGSDGEAKIQIFPLLDSVECVNKIEYDLTNITKTSQQITTIVNKCNQSIMQKPENNVNPCTKPKLEKSLFKLPTISDYGFENDSQLCASQLDFLTQTTNSTDQLQSCSLEWLTNHDIVKNSEKSKQMHLHSIIRPPCQCPGVIPQVFLPDRLIQSEPCSLVVSPLTPKLFTSSCSLSSNSCNELTPDITFPASVFAQTKFGSTKLNNQISLFVENVSKCLVNQNLVPYISNKHQVNNYLNNKQQQQSQKLVRPTILLPTPSNQLKKQHLRFKYEKNNDAESILKFSTKPSLRVLEPSLDASLLSTQSYPSQRKSLEQISKSVIYVSPPTIESSFYANKSSFKNQQNSWTFGKQSPGAKHR